MSISHVGKLCLSLFPKKFAPVCTPFLVHLMFTYFYFWERDRDRAWVEEGQREREAQNLKQPPGSEVSAQSPTPGSNPRAVRSWPEPKWVVQLTEPPRCPYVFFFFKKKVYCRKCLQSSNTAYLKPFSKQLMRFLGWFCYLQEFYVMDYDSLWTKRNLSSSWSQFRC